MALTEVRF